MSEMSSKKPYVTRAFYQWIVDNGCTPYLLLNTKSKRVEVPKQFVKNNKIILDVSPTSVKDFEIHNEYVYFKAQFKGVEETIYAPIEAVLAIYAAEDGDGFMFEEEPIPNEPRKKEDSNDSAGCKSDGGFLKLVD
jgi:stringent starvation protein B